MYMSMSLHEAVPAHLSSTDTHDVAPPRFMRYVCFGLSAVPLLDIAMLRPDVSGLVYAPVAFPPFD